MIKNEIEEKNERDDKTNTRYLLKSRLWTW